MVYRFGRINGFSPEIEFPVNQSANLLVGNVVFDDDGPCTDSALAPGSRLDSSKNTIQRYSPVFDGHEGPVLVAIGAEVILAVCGKRTDQSSRGNQIDAHLSSLGMAGIHGDRNLLNAFKICFLQLLFGDDDLSSQPGSAFGNLAIDCEERRVIPCLRLEFLKGLCSMGHGVGVELSVSVLVIVLDPSCSFDPVRIVRVDGNSSLYGESLQVAPR